MPNRSPSIGDVSRERRLRVFVSHPYWPHYRLPVMRELIEHGAHEYTFLGGAGDPLGSVRAADASMLREGRFVLTPTSAVAGDRILWQRGLIGASLRRDIDVFVYHGHYGHISTWIAAALARLTGKRVLFWTHGYTREDHGLKRAFRKTFYRLAHFLMFYGHYAKNVAVSKIGFAPERIHVIYNSLDLAKQLKAVADVSQEELASLRRDFFADADTPVVVCVIRLLASRRLDMVIDAVAKLAAAGRRVNVLLVGEGAARDALAEQARKRGVNVHFFGACYDEAKLARLTMLANVTVCPGPVGLTAIQSLTFGVPVISNDDFATQMPEFEAILDGRTGGFFRLGDVDSLASHIERWTRQSWVEATVSADCQQIIEQVWNPETQRLVIDRAVTGAAGNDLAWSQAKSGISE